MILQLYLMSMEYLSGEFILRKIAVMKLVTKNIIRDIFFTKNITDNLYNVL